MQGTVLVQFTVKADGSVAGVSVKKSVDPFLDREAVRVVKSLPRFKPAKLGSNPVDSSFVVPVAFRLQ